MRTYPVWHLAHEGEYGDLLDALLSGRRLGLDELDTGPEGLHRPELLTDLDRGAQRIERAVRQDETIVVYGDYDVDGVSSTALLLDFLEHVKARGHALLPDRRTDGYGLKPPGVRKALDLGADLMVTVDNGISAGEALELARDEGLDVVVIDHHRQNEELPPAHSIINPNRLDCDYPFKGLAGVGVTFKVVQRLSESLLESGERRRYLNDLLDLVALGTVADMVPLLDENRILVRHGLKAVERSARPGLQELRIAARCPRGRVDSTAVAFYLGPRLNVAGRLEKPDLALDLLRTRDHEEGRLLAGRLNELNLRRQQLQREGVREARSLVSEDQLERERLLCVLGEEWDLGVIGLIASDLSETFWRPAVVLTDVQRDGSYVGSARSIPGYDMNDGLRHCSRFLTRYGGHAGAAGFSLPAEAFEEFRASLIDHAGTELTPEHLEAHLEIDLELQPGDIDMRTVEVQRRLEPFGQENRMPLFLTRGLELVSRTRVGKEGEHLKVAFQAGGVRPGVWWHQGALARDLETGQRLDVAYELSEDTFNGMGTVQMVIRDMDPSPGCESGPAPAGSVSSAVLDAEVP
ncbi:MAG: single-stranded-DNA-specific exonuclease RecJ [Gemmatimonadaceae bacterium]|nr:single-stranded-DNA-specific exonuclease RecJ [Gemmatimonadaceae bacterium]